MDLEKSPQELTIYNFGLLIDHLTAEKEECQRRSNELSGRAQAFDYMVKEIEDRIKRLEA